MKRRLSFSSVFGSWSGKLPSATQQVLDQVDRELLEQRADEWAGHPVAAVDDDLQRLHGRRSMKASASRWKFS